MLLDRENKENYYTIFRPLIFVRFNKHPLMLRNVIISFIWMCFEEKH